MKVSVLITTRNRPKEIMKAISNVAQQNCDLLEILIHDDASEPSIESDLEVKKWMASSPITKILRSEKSRGVSGSRNLLASRARGELLLFLDDDAEFANENAANLAKEAFTQHPDVGVLAFKVINHYEDNTKEFLVPFQKWMLENNNKLLNEQNLVSYFVGAGHAILKSVFMDVQYDEKLFWGEEELDLSLRYINKGGGILYVPSIEVNHFPKKSTLPQHSPEILYHVQNRFVLAKKFFNFNGALIYLVVWLFVYFKRAISTKKTGVFFKGLVKGFKMYKSTEKVKLTHHYVNYLKQNYGRKWY